MVTSGAKRSTPEEEIRAFSDRLNQLLDARGFAAKGKGRQVELAKRYDLTQKGVRKWVEGEGLPETARMMQIARDLQCNFQWLAQGTGPRDVDPSAYSPEMELLQRMESAPAETRTLIELALMSDSDMQSSSLSPSLKGLIGFVKQQIKEEASRGKPQN